MKIKMRRKMIKKKRAITLVNEWKNTKKKTKKTNSIFWKEKGVGKSRGTVYQGPLIKSQFCFLCTYCGVKIKVCFIDPFLEDGQ